MDFVGDCSKPRVMSWFSLRRSAGLCCGKMPTSDCRGPIRWQRDSALIKTVAPPPILFWGYFTEGVHQFFSFFVAPSFLLAIPIFEAIRA